MTLMMIITLQLHKSFTTSDEQVCDMSEICIMETYKIECVAIQIATIVCLSKQMKIGGRDGEQITSRN